MMAYRITYGWENEPNEERNRMVSPGLVLGVMAVTAALLIRLLIPQSDRYFRVLLHPLTDEYTQSMFADMVDGIGAGVPVSEAVTVFCREIIENGQ